MKNEYDNKLKSMEKKYDDKINILENKINDLEKKIEKNNELEKKLDIHLIQKFLKQEMIYLL